MSRAREVGGRCPDVWSARGGRLMPAASCCNSTQNSTQNSSKQPALPLHRCRRTLGGCLSWLASHLGSMWGSAPAGAGGSSVAVGAPAAPPPPTCPRCTSEVCQAYGVPARVYHGELGGWCTEGAETLAGCTVPVNRITPSQWDTCLSRHMHHPFLPSASSLTLQWTCYPPRCPCAFCGSCPAPSRWISALLGAVHTCTCCLS